MNLDTTRFHADFSRILELFIKKHGAMPTKPQRVPYLKNSMGYTAILEVTFND